MNRNVIAIQEHASCGQAVEIFLRHSIAALPVVSRSNEVVEILSPTDLLFKISPKQRVNTVATKQVVSLSQGATIKKAVRLFQKKRLRSIPVVDRSKRLVGILPRRNIFAYYYTNHQNLAPP